MFSAFTDVSGSVQALQPRVHIEYRCFGYGKVCDRTCERVKIFAAAAAPEGNLRNAYSRIIQGFHVLIHPFEKRGECDVVCNIHIKIRTRGVIGVCSGHRNAAVGEAADTRRDNGIALGGIFRTQRLNKLQPKRFEQSALGI